MVMPVVRPAALPQNSAQVVDDEDFNSRLSTVASPAIAANGAMPPTSPRKLTPSVQPPEVNDPEKDDDDEDEEDGVRVKGDVFEDDPPSNVVLGIIQNSFKANPAGMGLGLAGAVFGLFPALMSLTVCIGLISLAAYFTIQGTSLAPVHRRE